MSKYIKKFTNHSQYESFTGTSEFILPNVSLCVYEDDVHYNPYVEPQETRIVAKFNVTDTTNPTRIAKAITSFTAIEIDGVEQPSVVSAYTFSTTGEHTVKYTLLDITNIGDNAFTNCSGLTNIIIPDNVTSIGEGAFWCCSGLTSCTIGSGVTSIGSYAFYSATSLTSIVIPDSVTSIGREGFRYCSGLTSCTIGSGITTINSNAFSGCTNINNISVNSHTIERWFRDSYSVSSLTLGNNVAIIGSSAFTSFKITSVSIPSGVTSIGNKSFYFCTGLTSINIPDSVTSIGERAFEYCSGLTSISLGSGVTNIDDSAFFYCGVNLSSITVSNNSVYDSRNNCNAIIITATNTLRLGCKTTIIPNTVTSIGPQAFNNCTGLTSIDIPNSVTTIGSGAFATCSGLTSIGIPSGVTSIDIQAFYRCSSLTSIVSNATTAPTIQSSTFQGVGTNGTLTVPIGSSGYDVWMDTSNYYLGKYNWTKVEQ